MEKLTAVISEIDITEQDIPIKCTKIPSAENTSTQTGNYRQEDGKKCEKSFERDLANITPNEDMKNLEKVLSEESSEKELSSVVLAAATAVSVTTKIMQEFQFTEPGLPNESNETVNSEQKTGEDVLSEIQDLNPKENLDEFKEMENDSQVSTPSEKTQKTESCTGKSTKTLNKKFTILHDDDFSDNENSADLSMVSLLRSTICELERALRDSRALIKTRDEEIVSLRKEVEKDREQIHKEQLKWQRKCAVVDERGREIQELKKKVQDSEKTVEELSERIKEFESPCSESDDIVACCSSMKELLELKMEVAEKDAIIKEIRKNNPEEVLESAIVSAQGWKAKEKRVKAESEEHNQLKLKFLRDAFFYFMIDFHSEEQIKAILAVLSYGDQREDVIYQAYRMRQRGKKFTVKEVSSRELAFLHEQI